MSGTYDRWTTSDLWAMLAGENDADTHMHLNAWEQKQQLLDDQLKLLRTQRDQLAEHWSPEHSPAAKAFIDRIDLMIQTLTRAGGSVAGVRQTYRHVTDAIRDARRELKPLHARYYDHRAARSSDPLAAWMPDSWVPDTPDVLARYQRRVDEQARAVMERMDVRVTEATADPAEIQPMQRLDRGDGLTLTSGGGSAHSGGGSPHIVQPPFDPPPMHQPPVPSPMPGESPVLAGGPPPFVAQTGSPAVISAPPAKAPTAVVPPFAPRVQPFGRPNVPVFNGVIGAPPNSPTAAAPAERPMTPTNGIIGGPAVTPTSGTRAPFTRPPTTSPTVTPAAARPTPGGGWQDRSYEQYTRRRAGRSTDPDEQWPVKEGVPPLIEAPADPGNHDAPPGVIGLDR